MYTDIIIPSLIMIFLGVIAASSIVFPILFLTQKNRQHKETINILKEVFKNK